MQSMDNGQLAEKIQQLLEQIEDLQSSSSSVDPIKLQKEINELKNLFSIKNTFKVQKQKQVAIQKPPVKVAITGAAGNIGYAIIFRIAYGEMLGYDQPIILSLIDIPSQQEKLMGISMEIEDCAFNTIHSVEFHTNQAEGFKNADYIILVGSIPMPKDCDQATFRTKYLHDNAKIFKMQALAIDENAKETCKILVVSNPCNSLAYLTAAWLKKIPHRNVTAMSRLDHNRAVSKLARRFDVPYENIEKLVIWGNHSATMFPDLTYCQIDNQLALEKLDKSQVEADFIPQIRNRAVEIVKWTKMTSIASAGNAAIMHIRDWALGTNGKWVSMAIESDGSYNIPKGLIFSYPCICKNGEYEIVQGLQINHFQKKYFGDAIEELFSEKEQLSVFLPENY